MELVERYLQAINTFLPAKNSSDILRELRENILSQVEEKEAELGRPVTQEELEAIIRQHGHPIIAAARYSPQRYLIGPTLFPFYRLTIIVTLLIALVARAVAVLMTILVSNGAVSYAAGLFAGIPETLLTIFAAVTLTFAAFEYLLSAYKISGKFQWEPSKLPALRRSRRTVSRVESAAGLIFGVAAAIWWQAFPAAPFLILGPGALFLEPAPVLRHVLHFPILLFIVIRALLCGYDLLRPQVVRSREWMEMALDAGQIVLMSLIFHAGVWVLPLSSLRDSARAGQIAQAINQSLRYALPMLLLIMVLQFAWRCYKKYRASRVDASALAVTTFA